MSESEYKHSDACCRLPPIIAEDDYELKGKYVELNGTKCYVTGPAEATGAILVFYDIFGFKPQILQGADILAYSDPKRPHMVFMPDFFAGDYAQPQWYPPDTEEKKTALYSWFGTVANPPNHLPTIQPLMKAAEEFNSSITAWGMIGYCWGGKMVSLVAGRKTAFKAGVQTSPALVDPADAEKVQIPMCMLASKEEPVDDVKKYEEALKGVKHIETFETEDHGFMSAKADLKIPERKEAYERGYAVALKFFHDNM